MSLTASAYDLTVGTKEKCSVIFKVNGNVVTTANKGDSVVVVVTPDTPVQEGVVYAVKDIQVKAYTSFGAAKTRSNSPAIVKNITPQWETENTYSFTMPDANALVDVVCDESPEALIVVIEKAEETVTDWINNNLNELIEHAGDTNHPLVKKLMSVHDAYRRARDVYDNPDSTEVQIETARQDFLNAL
jgi:hypothetical protein